MFSIIYNSLVDFVNESLEAAFNLLENRWYLIRSSPIPQVVIETRDNAGYYPSSFLFINYWLCWSRFVEYTSTIELLVDGKFVSQQDILNHKYSYYLELPEDYVNPIRLNYFAKVDLRLILFYTDWFILNKDGGILFFPEGINTYIDREFNPEINDRFFKSFKKSECFIYSNPNFLALLFKFIPSFCEMYILQLLGLYIKHMEFIYLFNIFFCAYSFIIMYYYRR